MTESERILSTEYNTQFDELRKKMMVMSYYKYGQVEENAKSGLSDFIKSLDIRYQAFKRTKNTEFLADIANICMMIFTYPDCFGCHYQPTDSTDSPGIDGCSVNDIKNFDTRY